MLLKEFQRQEIGGREEREAMKDFPSSLVVKTVLPLQDHSQSLVREL